MSDIFDSYFNGYGYADTPFFWADDPCPPEWCEDDDDALALWQERDEAIFVEMAEGMVTGVWAIPADEPAWF